MSRMLPIFTHNICFKHKLALLNTIGAIMCAATRTQRCAFRGIMVYSGNYYLERIVNG